MKAKVDFSVNQNDYLESNANSAVLPAVSADGVLSVQVSKFGGITTQINANSQLKSKAAELLLAALLAPDSAVLSHCKNVSKICEAVARRMNLTGAEIGEIKTAGMLHDIGKTEISDSLLNKLGQLEDDEWVRIKQHSAIGHRIVSSIDGFSRIAGFILEHHERWDGSGYPSGISGKDISLQARIIAVADAYDAMTSDRPYKKAVGVPEALAEIRANAGTQFDPAVVGAFFSGFKAGSSLRIKSKKIEKSADAICGIRFIFYPV